MENCVNVLWQTASEFNSDYFTIERSADGKNWKNIGKVTAAGNSSGTRRYAFTDELPPSASPSTHYYRLKQTDYDGRFEYFGPVSVSLSPADNWSLIFENPAAEQLKGSLTCTEDADITVQIIDLQGRIVKTEQLSTVKGSNFLQVDINGMDQGLYFIKVFHHQKALVSKFVKE